MDSRMLILGGALLALAACETPPSPYYGSSTAPYSYGSTAAARSAEEGCASGESADMLHQNRPGGSDYSPWRCHIRGY